VTVATSDCGPGIEAPELQDAFDGSAGVPSTQAEPASRVSFVARSTPEPNPATPEEYVTAAFSQPSNSNATMPHAPRSTREASNAEPNEVPTGRRLLAIVRRVPEVADSPTIHACSPRSSYVNQ